MSQRPETKADNEHADDQERVIQQAVRRLADD